MKFLERNKRIAVWVHEGKTNKQIGVLMSKSSNSVSVIKQSEEFRNLITIYNYNKKRFWEIINEEV